MGEKFLTVKAVAETYNVSVQTIYNWINSGDMPAYKFMGAYRISPEQLTEFESGSLCGITSEKQKEAIGKQPGQKREENPNAILSALRTKSWRKSA